MKYLLNYNFIPQNIRVIFGIIPISWRNRHLIIFIWLVVLQATGSGSSKLKGLADMAPSYITEWRFRRFLTAAYYSIHYIIYIFAKEAISKLPLPKDNTCYLIVDSSHIEKTGTKNPAAQKGKISKFGTYFFGIRFIVLLVCWDSIRIPIAFRIIWPKNHANYKKENALFLEMLKEFQPPDWAVTIIILGDSAYASKNNINEIKKLDKLDKQRRWGFVFGIAKTWKDIMGKSLRDLAYYLPRKFFKKTWIPKLPESLGRKVFWYYRVNRCLNGIGDVTIVLSKKGRNVGPKGIKMLVTNLMYLSERQILCIYNRRWSIEIVFKELKSGLGLGKQQVTKNERRIENSIGVSIVAYLFLIIICKVHINPLKTWSIFQLKSKFWENFVTSQIQRKFELQMKK